MKIFESYGVLAVPAGEEGANDFLDSPIGTAVVGLCGAIAILVAVVCIIRMIKHVTGGKPAEGVKIFLFGLVISALLINLNLTLDGSRQMSGLVSKVFDSIGSVTGDDSGSADGVGDD